MSGKAKRLNESQRLRLEVISKLSQTNSPSKRSIARQNKVGVATVGSLGEARSFS